MKIVTGKVRASYVNVFKPRLNQLSNSEDYSMAILIPKEDKKTIDGIVKIIQTHMDEKHGKNYPKEWRNPLRDGDEHESPDYKGHYYMNVKSNRKPAIVGAEKDEFGQFKRIEDELGFVSGDYCRVSLNSYYFGKVAKGVAFGLQAIQFLERGEPLGTVVRPEDDFADTNPVKSSETDKNGVPDWM